MYNNLLSQDVRGVQRRCRLDKEREAVCTGRLTARASVHYASSCSSFSLVLYCHLQHLCGRVNLESGFGDRESWRAGTDWEIVVNMGIGSEVAVMLRYAGEP